MTVTKFHKQFLLKDFVRQVQWFGGFIPCVAPSGFSKRPRPQKVGLVTLATAETGKIPTAEVFLSR